MVKVGGAGTGHVAGCGECLEALRGHIEFMKMGWLVGWVVEAGFMFARAAERRTPRGPDA